MGAPVTAATLKALASQRPIIGGWVGTNSPQLVGAIRESTFDFVVVDTQHSVLTIADCAPLLAGVHAGDFPMMVRVDSNNPATIGRALDLGASGIIVPLVETAEQAEAAVRACHYPPQGTRSFGPIRSDLSGQSLEELSGRALLFVMVETRLGLENVFSIADNPGVDGIFIGPVDLSISLGLNHRGAFSTDQLKEHFAVVRAAADQYGLILGSFGVDAASTQRWIDYGCTFVPVNMSERGLFNAGVSALAGELGIGAEH